MIYNLYIFDRRCACSYYVEFQNRANFTSSGGLKSGNHFDYYAWPESGNNTGGTRKRDGIGYYLPPNFSELEFLERTKLIYGVVFSLKTFAHKLAGPLEDGFLSFKTNRYKLHYYETLSGLRFVTMTDANSGSMLENLKFIFSSLYTDYILKNPLSSTSIQLCLQGSLLENKEELDTSSKGHSWYFNNQLFTTNLVQFLSQLPNFN